MKSCRFVRSTPVRFVAGVAVGSTETLSGISVIVMLAQRGPNCAWVPSNIDEVPLGFRHQHSAMYPLNARARIGAGSRWCFPVFHGHLCHFCCSSLLLEFGLVGSYKPIEHDGTYMVYDLRSNSSLIIVRWIGSKLAKTLSLNLWCEYLGPTRLI